MYFTGSEGFYSEIMALLMCCGAQQEMQTCSVFEVFLNASKDISTLKLALKNNIYQPLQEGPLIIIHIMIHMFCCCRTCFNALEMKGPQRSMKELPTVLYEGRAHSAL